MTTIMTFSNLLLPGWETLEAVLEQLVPGKIIWRIAITTQDE